MNSIGSRINELRKTLNLSMDKFGSQIGITKSSVNSLEKCVNNPSEQTLKLICREYNVDYFWLTEGIGDMFMAIPENIIDELAEQYNLGTAAKSLVKFYVNLPKHLKDELEEALQKTFNIKK